MIEIITREELDFIEDFYDPICMAECLFSDLDNMSFFEENKFCEIRIGQFPLLSFEYCIDTDNALSVKENFKRRERAGSLWCFGGRKFGKTLIVEEVDICLNYLLQPCEWVGFSSFDAGHIIGVLEPVIFTLENHPFLKMFAPKVKRSPSYRITNSLGWTLESINMNILGKNPGENWFQKHFTRIYIEEGSKESQGCYEKRLDAISEDGCVYRVAGMTDFTRYSPAGQAFFDLGHKNWVCNLPQYVSPKWDDEEKKKAAKKHGGENSVSYRVFVKGQVVEEGIAALDMEKVRKCYLSDKVIKHLEITKENFESFKQILIVERPRNATLAYINADIGDSAPTEVVVFFKINEKYRYEYNITLYGLTDKQQYKIFCHLIQLLTADFIALDCGDGTGRAIYRSLEESHPPENLIYYAGNKKIQVDTEKDEYGKDKFKDGIPCFVEEFMSEWSVKHLKDLFYDEKLIIPIDHKLDVQLNSVVSITTSNRTKYSCLSKEDHLFDSFKVFATAVWMTEFKKLKHGNNKQFCKSGA